MDDSYIYIALPYTDDDKNIVEERVVIAMKYAATLFQKGEYAFSVVVHCHEMSKRFNMPKTYDFWKHYCEIMIKNCKEVHLLQIEGYKESVGCAGEIEIANNFAKPVYEIPPCVWEA